jgi:dTDP-glucose pyrophosphorylase
MNNWRRFIIPYDHTVRQALRLLDEIGIASRALFIEDKDKKLVGSLTDGDIRRGLLKDVQLEDHVDMVMFRGFRSFHMNKIDPRKFKEYKEYGIRHLPLVDEAGMIVDLLDLDEYKAVLPVDAVLMAGGRGERLLPLTKDLPKSLLQVGSKPIIEYNIDRFIQHGIHNIFVSINYLGEKISARFGNGSDKKIHLSYLREDKPLGTIGVLGKADASFIYDDILVMNADLLTNIDFSDFYKKFKSSGADMAVATIPHHIDLPYAILEVEENSVISLKEKPRYTYFANAGIYLLKKDVLRLIPVNEKFDATDLMEAVIENKLTLIQYEVLEYWLDIGRIGDFEKAQEDIKKIRL